MHWEGILSMDNWFDWKFTLFYCIYNQILDSDWLAVCPSVTQLVSNPWVFNYRYPITTSVTGYLCHPQVNYAHLNGFPIDVSYSF